jgi:hypothetical protein
MPFVEDEDYEKAARNVGQNAESMIDSAQMSYFLRPNLNVLARSEISCWSPIMNCQDEALFDSESGIVRIRRSAFEIRDHRYRGSKREYQHFRFTVAHEIGHVIGGHEGTHYRGVTSTQIKRVPSRAKRNERQADRLASHILAPSHLAEAVMQARKIGKLPPKKSASYFTSTSLPRRLRRNGSTECTAEFTAYHVRFRKESLIYSGPARRKATT